MSESPRMVHCIKLGQELPGLEKPPYQSELGQRIYEQVSQQGWKMWTEHAKLLINEGRLDLSRPECQAFLMDQCEAFFFGTGSAAPEEFTPAPPGGGPTA